MELGSWCWGKDHVGTGYVRAKVSVEVSVGDTEEEKLGLGLALDLGLGLGLGFRVAGCVVDTVQLGLLRRHERGVLRVVVRQVSLDQIEPLAFGERGVATCDRPVPVSCLDSLEHLFGAR